MRTEAAATIVRGLLIAASLGAIIWSGAVLGMPKTPIRGAVSDPVLPPKPRGILADLVFKTTRRGSAPADWPASWTPKWQAGLRPHLASSGSLAGLTRGIARAPQTEFWLPAPSAPPDWRSP